MTDIQTVRIPSAHDDDFEDVHLALSAASTLWRAGDDDEALKWLRRAAGAAAEQDADMRAVELAKAAADVATVIEERNSSIPPRQTPPPLPTPMRAPAARQPTHGPTRRHAAPAQRNPEGTGHINLASLAGPPRGRTAINPPFPPELSHLQHVDFRLEEGEEETFVRPETKLRRALLAIDPDYAQRTDFDQPPPGAPRAPVDFPAIPTARDSVDTETDPDPPTGVRALGHSHVGIAQRTSASVIEPADAIDDSEETQRRRRPVSAPQELRVAVIPIPEEGDVRLLFLPPGAKAPPGVATALLVPPSPEDAALLAKLYQESDAKL